MSSPRIVIFLILIIYLRSVYSFVDLSYFKTYISSLIDDKESEFSDVKEPKELCDENQIMLQLAKLYVINPERVMILLTGDSLLDSCKNLDEAMNKINKTQTCCIPLNPENLYMKLLRTVEFFYSSICESDTSLKKKINKIGDCLLELREEFLDCQGSADWYEKPNTTVRCQIFNDIVNCNYVRTAMLCGLEPAATIREFSAELFQYALPLKEKCKVCRSLPFVQDPMISSTNSQTFIYSISHLTSFIFLIKILS